MVVKEQKSLKENEVTGKKTFVEDSGPCCMPGCCDNSSSNQ